MARLTTCCGDPPWIHGGTRHFDRSSNSHQTGVSPHHQPKALSQMDRWNSMRGNLAPRVYSNSWRWPTQVDLDATPNHMSVRPAIPRGQTPTGSTLLHRPQLPTFTCTQLAIRRTLGLSMVGATWIQHRSCHRLHTQRWPDWYVYSYSQPHIGHHAIRWRGLLPQVPMACTDSTACETYGDMIVTAPSRRANLHNEQPRRGRASTPRRHNTPKRHVTPPRPVVIRAEAPPAPAPAAPTHPWLTPETNWEEDPWTRAEREHAEQQEARAKAKAPPPPAPYSAQEPPAGPPVTPSINPPRQHRVEQTPITRAFETLRQTAGSSVQSIPASVPAPSPAPTPLSSHRWLHQQTPTSWHSHGTWSVDFRLHRLHQESQTPYWVHGLKDHRSNLPASCHQHTCMACRPSYEKTAASNWTVSSWPSSHPCLRTITRWALAHGAQSYRATWHHKFQAINTSIAFSWSPWPPKHKPPTPLYSSFGGTNISCSPGMWHKNASPIVVRGPPSYQTICRPFFWLPSTSWKWLAQWDHPMNFANQKVRPWPP